MKKKILMFLCAVCFIVPTMFCMSACSTNEGVSDIQIPTDYTVTMKNDQTEENEEIVQHRITIINDTNCGAIYPKLDNGNSSVLVNEGDSYTVTIKAEDGFKLDHLLVDGKKVNAVSVYTFTNVSTDHTISAVFSEVIDNRHFITGLALKGMIFDLYPTVKNQEIESLSYTLGLYKFDDGGSTYSFKLGYVYCGENKESKFTNSLNFDFEQLNISFNDSIRYEIVLSVGLSDVLIYSFVPNKMELELVSDNIYMIKLDNQTKAGYNYHNIVLYFSATFE